MAEFTLVLEMKVKMESVDLQHGIYLLTVLQEKLDLERAQLKGHKLNCVVRFGFKATNNVAEYEALLES